MRTWLVTVFALTLVASISAEEKKDAKAFSSTTIDLGIVVSDVEKAVKFYTDAIGFKEIEGFSVPAEYCKDVGLTDGKPLKIRVLVLGEGETATKLKLMEIPGTKMRKSDNDFIHSQSGFRYLTIFVNDTTAAMEKLTKSGVKTVAKTPMELPKGLPQGVYLTIVRDPDGNFVELVGPKK
jgi:predicted enzyme related to lactoylglutathione lyase